ncbi:MAG: hypothetical protein ABEJ58_03260 [Halodesulfurarchaeum sp.]
MIVVSTADFECYHDLVAELRARQTDFTTIETDEPLPPDASILIVGEGEDRDVDVPVIVAEPNAAREAVEEAMATLRGDDGRIVVGIDPGARPGIAVLDGGTVVAAFQVPLEEVGSIVESELETRQDAVVRIGDGDRLKGNRLIEELSEEAIELVDETGTTPYLGTGARGMGDVLAAVNIARSAGEPIEHRSIEPTEGEIQVIKDRSRRLADGNRTLPESLARKVATGALTMEEALSEHRTETGQ